MQSKVTCVKESTQGTDYIEKDQKPSEGTQKHVICRRLAVLTERSKWPVCHSVSKLEAQASGNPRRESVSDGDTADGRNESKLSSVYSSVTSCGIVTRAQAMQSHLLGLKSSLQLLGTV